MSSQQELIMESLRVSQMRFVVTLQLTQSRLCCLLVYRKPNRSMKNTAMVWVAVWKILMCNLHIWTLKGSQMFWSRRQTKSNQAFQRQSAVSKVLTQQMILWLKPVILMNLKKLWNTLLTKVAALARPQLPLFSSKAMEKKKQGEFKLKRKLAWVTKFVAMQPLIHSRTCFLLALQRMKR